MSSRGTAAVRATTLGLLAGGEASRLGGIDKASLAPHGGAMLGERLRARFAGDVDAVLLSANVFAADWETRGMQVVRDRHAGIGPMGGIDALAAACTTPWLLTLPVDAHDAPSTVAALLLAGPGDDGAWLEDAGGVQPLVALWRVAALRAVLPAVIASGDHSVRRLQARLAMRAVSQPALRIGNLNTHDDLRDAGIHDHAG